MENFLYISLGAILGANARFWLANWAAGKWGESFPYGTMLINLSGSFLLGLLLIMSLDRFEMDPRLRTLLFAGFLGSYTTFSTYTNESIVLLTQGQWGAGLFNLFGSALLGGVAAAVGILVGRAL